MGWTRALVIPVVKGLVYAGTESDLPLRPVRKNPAALAPLLPHCVSFCPSLSLSREPSASSYFPTLLPGGPPTFLTAGSRQAVTAGSVQRAQHASFY